jgi:hypothetical protein
MRFPNVTATFRAWAGVSAGVLCLLVAMSCSDDSKVPTCDNCEAWTQIVDDLGRYPASHPSDPDFVVYSTIRKGVQADSTAESDEDLWLLWRGSSDRSQWVRWQLTGPELGEGGDNFHARWSPSGTQVAFVHTDQAGTYEIWRLGVILPPGDPPSPSFDPRAGLPERIVSSGRDPSWQSENRILFSRANNLYHIDITGARDGVNETQITFDPPPFSGADEFIDRQPFATSDGVIVFSTEDRVPVGNLLIGAFEILPGAPPETTATTALLSLQTPGDPTPAYPVLSGPDTLFTTGDDADPYITLRAIPAGAEPYIVGVRRDSARFPGEESYCDSLIVGSVEVRPGESVSIDLYFELARGTLIVTTGEIATSMFWRRDDGLETETANIGLPCQNEIYECLLSHQVDVNGNPIPGTLEPFHVLGTSSAGLDSITVFVPPGETTFVKLFCPDDVCGCLPPVSRSALSAPGRTRRGGSSRAWSGLRAGDPSGIWRVDLSDPNLPKFTPIVTSQASLQTPLLSDVFAGGVRYLAYASNESGQWALYVQKLDAALVPIGERVQVETPGTSDNFICTRNIFHPAFVTGSSPGNLRILVTMTDCPDNGFEGSGIDDDPWSQGELNVWEVVVPVE